MPAGKSTNPHLRRSRPLKRRERMPGNNSIPSSRNTTGRLRLRPPRARQNAKARPRRCREGL